MLDFLIWYLVIGFVIAVLGDAFNAWQEVKTKVYKPETRFYLVDTVFVTVAWPIVLWAATKEAFRG